MANPKLNGLVLGIVIGLLVGLNLSGLWPQVPLHAVATHGQDNFAICTGPMDQDVEAIFVLDCLTGDLKAAVMNVQMRRFNTRYEYNVQRDLALGEIKNPQFRIVSGYANIRQNVAAGQVGNSVIYVAEMSSGQLVAYGVPWVSGRASGMMPVTTTLIPLDKWQFRTTAIRDQ